VGFDAIVVPRGAEARAVERGWPTPRPPLIAVPAGAAAASALTGVELAEVGLTNAGRVRTALVLGVCGALDPGLRIGDAVVYSRIVDGCEIIELDRELMAACAGLFACAPLGVAVVPRVVSRVTEKAAIRAATGAAVIDMEAASVARALHQIGMRVAMVRVVSDDALGELPNLNSIYNTSGALRPIALAFALLRAPGRSVVFIVHALNALRALQATASRLAHGAAGETVDENESLTS
jgi:hypothetical protein